jgi:hypothetical protein
MHMAAGQTGFADVTYDLIVVQYHALKAAHDHRQYVRDAETPDRATSRSSSATP